MHKEFRVHILNDQGKAKARQIAASFDELLSKIEGIVGEPRPSREMALVRTKLEEACFFAKKAMAERACNVAETMPR